MITITTLGSHSQLPYRAQRNPVAMGLRVEPQCPPAPARPSLAQYLVPKAGHWPRLTMSPLLSFQVTSSSLEASTAIHPPARESEPRLGTPAGSLSGGPRTAQELGPARCRQSSLDGAGPDLTGTGRHQPTPVWAPERGELPPQERGSERESGTALHCVVAAV